MELLTFYAFKRFFNEIYAYVIKDKLCHLQKSYRFCQNDQIQNRIWDTYSGFGFDLAKNFCTRLDPDT
jgi:hypothetical protein